MTNTKKGSNGELIRHFLGLVGAATLCLTTALTVVLYVGSPIPGANHTVQSPIPARCSPSGSTRRFRFLEEPLAPTPVPGSGEMDAATLDSLYVRAELALALAPLAEPHSLRWRTGVGIPDKNPRYFAWTTPRPGWYLNWTADFYDADMLGLEFVPMVRTPAGELEPNAHDLYKLALKHPGHTWLIGNEPDVEWQDDATPEEYARAFFCAHTALTRADPTAQIAIAGLSQITPLRLAWLDRAWGYYRREFGTEMPVDVWTMHAFVLREERASWGVRIPPGFWHVVQGELWDISDHTDLRLIEGQVRLMRQWMYDHDQREKPLIISEYGVLLPAIYGFTPDQVRDFMVQSFDLFNSLRDPNLGYSADDHRLVQRWVWFSSRYALYPAGNLFNAYSRPTLLMRSLSQYLATHQPQ